MNEKANENSWIPLIVVACASFIIVLDSFFMNVSISRIVVDLNTDVSTIQMIVSFCTLITAALILLSTKLQDIIGKKKLFIIGVILFGIGIFTAVISSNVIMFFVGWSGIKGVAAALIVPAIVSIISGTYSGRKRTIALAALGMVAGLADTLAPLIGGVITTFLSWRYTFAFELIFLVFILVMQNKITDFKPTESKNDLDISGAIVSIISLVLLVLGILTLTKELTISIVEIILGLIVMAIFIWYELKRKRSGKVPLLDVDLFRDKHLCIGASIKLLYNLVISGTFFVMVLFFQTVLQFNPLYTGLASLPFVLGLLIFSSATPKLIGKLNHKTLMTIGCIISIIGCLILSYQFKLNLSMPGLIIGQFLLGAGIGFIMALSADVALFDIPSKSQNNVSGIISTGETLGSSMGTAIIGIILILGVMGGISTAVDTYAPDHSGDEQFHQEIYNHFQKIDTLEGQDSIVVNTADIIIQEAMAAVMYVLAIVLGIILILTLQIKNNNINKQ
ncbi:MFS transporter (plasmid) [Methanosphaera sp. ISO3-F5]|uniref:MFS transporter n=1 Tax=Methanosphaera sp. ISO3-F5 TaxID=1452353 RepID=UPI002B25B6BF|nr:MFS transporter [Methanosphaera sp. ISO3-F5]WQH65429.1 MFS transporter [Methanosphaera sp. ISO3-F5]